MSRNTKIQFQRVTFSFPKKVILSLREKIPNNQMSAYVAALVEKDLAAIDQDEQDFFAELEELRSSLPAMEKSSLELLREIRYA